MTSDIQLEVSPLPLALRHAFRIAHGTSHERTNALLTLSCRNNLNVKGLGEAALPPYYPWTISDVEAYIRSLPLESLDVSVAAHDSVRDWLEHLPDGPATARAAVDMAVHDAWARHRGESLHVALGLEGRQLPTSTYALPIPESLTELDRMLSNASGFPFLKLKLGSGDPAYDVDVVRHARKRYSGSLCADVNSGWSIDEACECIAALGGCALEFIEQPVEDGWQELNDRLQERVPAHCRAPLVADESVQDLESIRALAPHVDGINIKLAKCGGISGALPQVRLARQLNLKCMLGCMIESSIALTAAAHIGALFDWLDLDGTMHTAADPFEGLLYRSGDITLPAAAGLGVRPRRAPV
ncbi:MAG: hypothetical protein COV99_06240 [Bacteroidetes bacterium CG12_big_fil_rev_8_21_14_0_65_60_17]|nr:MAG: hypothetical protein COV99_06240 [Bacteroidetes bacterium CG12_big_fil_rev_8_21_14_0_65_60_17]